MVERSWPPPSSLELAQAAAPPLDTEEESGFGIARHRRKFTVVREGGHLPRNQPTPSGADGLPQVSEAAPNRKFAAGHQQPRRARQPDLVRADREPAGRGGTTRRLARPSGGLRNDRHLWPGCLDLADVWRGRRSFPCGWASWRRSGPTDVPSSKTTSWTARSAVAR